MDKKRTRRACGWKAWALWLICSAAPQWAWAADEVLAAADCKLSDAFGSDWRVVEPLTTQSEPGQVLYERFAPILLRYTVVGLPGEEEKFRLLASAMWFKPPIDIHGAVPTNVQGIGLRILFQDAPIDTARMHRVLAAHDLERPSSGSGFVLYRADYRQQLILTAKPEDLPLKLRVTGVAADMGMAIGFFTAPVGAVGVGAMVPLPHWEQSLPTDPPGAKLCVIESVYQGDRIFGMGANGDGQSIDIKHHCEAGAHQDIRVDMPPAYVADFPAEGVTSAAKPFHIQLNRCSALARPQVKFRAKSGLVAGTDSVLALRDAYADGRQPAKGIGIIVEDGNDERVRFGPVGGAYGPEYAMVPLDGGAKLSLAARYIRTAKDRNDLQGGVANAAAEFTFEFP